MGRSNSKSNQMAKKRTGSKAGRIRARGPEKVSIKLRVNEYKVKLTTELVCHALGSLAGGRLRGD